VFSTANQWAGSQRHPAFQPNGHASLVDTVVGHYAILSRIGGGSQGTVYLARDTKLGRLVTLKFLLPQWSYDETSRERFVREAQAGSAAEHPHICTIYGVEATDDGQLFIVMAYCEGQTLKRKLENGPLSVNDAIEIATQLAEGLAAAHSRGVVHRDIKPGNLVLTAHGVKILDFGLARFEGCLQLTATDSLIGTVAYMSPEQLRGEEADFRSDVWAAGVVLYEMLAGRPPYRGEHTDAVAYSIRNEDVPALPRLHGLTPDVERVVFRALQKNPRERFQSARDFARALRRVQGASQRPALSSWLRPSFLFTRLRHS
jgi:serine/threonine-protein kinase